MCEGLVIAFAFLDFKNDLDGFLKHGRDDSLFDLVIVAEARTFLYFGEIGVEGIV